MKTITTKSKKILADTYTPVSIYLKIRDLFPKSILLESTDFHHIENCYSFICMQPIADFSVSNNQISIKLNGLVQEKKVATNSNVISELQDFFNSFKSKNSKHFSLTPDRPAGRDRRARSSTC